MLFASFIRLEVMECQSNRPEGLLSVKIDNCADLLPCLIVKLTNLAFSIHILGAALKNNLRSSLNHQPLVVLLLLRGPLFVWAATQVSALDNRGHSLAA